MKKLFFVNGFNLNCFGVCEVNVYGKGMLVIFEVDMK